MAAAYIGAAAIGVLYELQVLLSSIFFGISSYVGYQYMVISSAFFAVGNWKEGIKFAGLSIALAIFAASQLKMTTHVSVTGQRGTVKYEFNNSEQDLPVNKMVENWQIENSGYGKADDWVEITLKKGETVWGGTPGQSNFYTTNEVAQIVGNDATKLYQRLQVGKGNFPSYRIGFTQYKVNQEVRVAYSKALANPQISKGGFDQYFIPDYENVLDPILSRIMINR